jgi:hypothetical protein
MGKYLDLPRQDAEQKAHKQHTAKNEDRDGDDEVVSRLL